MFQRLRNINTELWPFWLILLIPLVSILLAVKDYILYEKYNNVGVYRSSSPDLTNHPAEVEIQLSNSQRILYNDLVKNNVKTLP